MKEKILVLAYPGSGKTYLANNYKNVCDYEFQHYKYDYGEYKHLPLEQLKGRKEIRTNKTDWPNNFFRALDIELQKGRIVLVAFVTSTFEVLEYLEYFNDVRIVFAIQDIDSFETIAENFRKRGNSKEFIETRKNDFQKCHEVFKNVKFEKVNIKNDEFLSDALIKIGIKLQKGKGIKNYI